MKKKYGKYILINLVVLIITAIILVPTLKHINYGLDLKGGFEVLYLVENLDTKKKVSDSELKATYKSITNRIDTLGVSEPDISIEGNKIRVKLPGVKNEEEARNRLSTPAVLSFRDSSDNLLMNASILKSPGASVDYDGKMSAPVVALDIKDNKTFYNVTKKISESEDKLIVIWLDFKEGVDSFASSRDKCGTDGNMSCISSATVKEGFMNNVFIQGSFTEKQASNLVDLINSGSLPTKLTEISSKSVDASFGSNTLIKTGLAGALAVLIISIFLIIRYRVSGFISSVCLVIYTALTFVIFNAIDGVLTLPGIAALILAVGMGVDCAIISLERIRDELNSTNDNLERAFINGNKSSIVSIIDANLTTLLAAVILFIYGESTVKGFATMLIITIILTIIILVYLNRFMLKEVVLKSDISAKKFVGFRKKTVNIDFIKKSKIFIVVSSIIIVIGIIFVSTKSLNFGIDFTGGSDITIKSTLKVDEAKVKNTFKDFKIVEMNNKDNVSYVKVSKTLNEKEIKNIKSDLKDYDVEINVISNLVKKDLTKNAIISLVLACIGIVIYVAFRFSMNYGLTGVLMLLHDVLVVIAVFAISRVQINFVFIASLLTIIGYSINDTIIVFDRIRYNKKKLFDNKLKTKEDMLKVINVSSNETIIRNILTTCTTLLTVIILLLFNITSLTSFNIAIIVGLLAGAVSSIFIAPYVLYLFEKRSFNKPNKPKKQEKQVTEKLIKGINS
ncbi:MAG: protein translocase subunit SecF [Bacilli bacterium]